MRVSAPGKIIVSGEHAVVYGYPAILAAIDHRLTVDIQKHPRGVSCFPQECHASVLRALQIIAQAFPAEIMKEDLKNVKISIVSEIPIGVGMGSSAAFAVALTGAVFAFFKFPLDRKKINDIAYKIEEEHHGTPSGADNTICTYGGLLLFRKKTDTVKSVCSFLDAKIPPMILINTGRPRESTKQMVQRVSNFVDQHPDRAQKIMRSIEQTTRDIIRIFAGEVSGEGFGEAIRRNEDWLEQLGVVSPQTRTLIRRIESVGGVAKVSGAGGAEKHSGMILVHHPDPAWFFSWAERHRLSVMHVRFGAAGVRRERDAT